ncbi:uncharacterized protein LOC124457119 [Xenia sp. Carnegie-2017]|uniref:uncharacterized protein LOC124457119 n=1 Tax=Xenia sp. Carnegie-2017 TaxID=2897299 RepID=UPI001F0386EE|nr:uncharacterized protein LOC124457119 [Xenia sp. Carnegie-2017]
MSEEDLNLFAAGFSAILGFHVVHSPAGHGLPKLSIHELFYCTYVTQLLENMPPKNLFNVHIKRITGSTTTIQVTKDHKIGEVKAAVEIKTKIPARDQQLMFNKSRLQDHHTIAELGVQPSGTIFLLIRAKEGGPDIQLYHSDLDPRYNCDFTSASDDGKVYMRGGKQCKRPYGWNRYAVKVLGIYDSEEWLGADGMRTEQAQGEWPVSYHGTKLQAAILKAGYAIGQKERHFEGVYSSPNVNTAATYAHEFTHNGCQRKIVLQNRVNPAAGRLEIIPAN